MLGELLQVVDSFSSGDDAPAVRRQDRAVIVIAWLCVPLMLFFAAEAWFRFALASATGVLLLGATLSLCTPLLLRVSKRSDLSAHFLAAHVSVVLGVVSFTRGGFVITVLIWSVIVPLASALVQRRDMTLLWGAFVALIAVGLIVLEDLGLAPPPSAHGDGRLLLFFVLALVVGLSITVQRNEHRVEQARAELQRQVEGQQRLEALGRLAGGMAHDFNNLLMIMQTSAELAKDQLADGESCIEDLDAVIAAALRGGELTGQLLTFGRQAVFERSAIDLRRVAMDAGPLFFRTLPESIRVTVAHTNEQLWVSADRRQLDQLLLNLVVNARDAMPDGGTLAIDIRETTLSEMRTVHGVDLRAGRYAVLVVEDSGTGIPHDVLPHIFEPFYTTKRDGLGTGLGLATVHGIVSGIGGAIALSTTTAGTRFEVMLPRVDAPASAAELLPDEAAAHEPLTVLVVEDEGGVRDAVRRVLERAGHRVLVAADGAQALALDADFDDPIDLLVTDVVMPHQSGREVAAVIRRARKRLSVIYMSGYASDEEVAREVEQHHAEFIQKPFSDDALLRKVQDVACRTAGSCTPEPAPAS